MVRRVNTSLPLAARVAKALAGGELIIAPVDTEYQLLASARQLAAIERAMARVGWKDAKPAPTLAYYDLEGLSTWGFRLNDAARKLADAFWPGPLELALPRPSDCEGLLCGGRDYALTRVPKHSFTREILRGLSQVEGRDAALAGISLAGPTGIPVTHFDHIARALGLDSKESVVASVAYVVGSGLLPFGIAPTLVDACRNEPKLRRLGPISATELETVWGSALTLALDEEKTGETTRQPPLVVLESEAIRALRLVGRAWVIARQPAPKDHPTAEQWIEVADDDATYARELFAAVYRATAAGASTIYVQAPNETPLGQALAAQLRALATKPAGRDNKNAAS
jgi:L-threonylcarbamoyladenylate synthase